MDSVEADALSSRLGDCAAEYGAEDEGSCVAGFLLNNDGRRLGRIWRRVWDLAVGRARVEETAPSLNDRPKTGYATSELALGIAA